MQTKQNLSAEEIAVLSQVATRTGGSASSGCVRPYDFARPDDVSRANLRALDTVFSDLGRLWPSVLSVALRTEAQIRVDRWQQSSFSEYADPLPASGLTFAVSMDPLPGRMFVHIPERFAHDIVNRMTGCRSDVEFLPGSLTRVEKNVVKCLMSRLSPGIAEALGAVISVRCAVQGLYSSPSEFGIDGDERMLSTDVTCRLGGNEYRLGMAFPAGALKSVLRELDPKKLSKPAETPGAASSGAMRGLIEAVDLPVSVRLGNARISVRDILDMKAGDVLRLNTTPRDSLDVVIGKRPAFRGRPGMDGSTLSVRITGPAEKAGLARKLL